MVLIINKQTSKDSDIMKLVRRFVVLMLTHNIMFKASHIPGKTNTAADLLSRLQIKQFKFKFPHMETDSTEINPNMQTLSES